MKVNPARFFRRLQRLPGYKRRDPDPISTGVMMPGQGPVAGWHSRRYRKYQARVDYQFWGLIHDHRWLQYEPPKKQD